MTYRQLRAALYLRVSTKVQDETTQEPDLRVQAEKDGVRVTCVFSDQISGLKNEKERSGLTDLLKLKKSDIDIVYVWEISRLSRDPTHFERLIGEFREKGINICFVKPQLLYLFDIQSGEEKISDSIALSIFSKFALHEILQKNARIKRGKKEAILTKMNSYTGKPPYGYYTENKKLYLNDTAVISEFNGFKTEVEVVRNVFEMYASGKSLSQIKKILNDYNLPTRSHDFIKKETLKLNGQMEKDKNEIKWGRRSIHNILSNTVYYGEKDIYSSEVVIQDGKRIKRRVKLATIDIDPIISKRLFLQVQIKFKENIAVADKSYKNEFLLRGKIKCGTCGKHYLGSGSKGRNYYQCADRTHRRQNTFVNCRSCSISVKIDEIVWKLMKSTYAGEKQKQSIAENLSKFTKESENLERQIKLKEAVLKENRSKTINLAKRLALADDSLAELMLNESGIIQQNSEQVEKELTEIKMQLSFLESRIYAITNDEVNSEFIGSIDDNFKLKKEAVLEILNEVIVFKIDNATRVLQVKFNNGYAVNVIYNWKSNQYCIAPDDLFTFDCQSCLFKRKIYFVEGFNLEVGLEENITPQIIFNDLKENGYLSTT